MRKKVKSYKQRINLLKSEVYNKYVLVLFFILKFKFEKISKKMTKTLLYQLIPMDLSFLFITTISLSGIPNFLRSGYLTAFNF